MGTRIVMSDLVSGIEVILFSSPLNELAEIASSFSNRFISRRTLYLTWLCRHCYRDRTILSALSLIYPRESPKMLTSNAKYLSINFCRFCICAPSVLVCNDESPTRRLYCMINGTLYSHHSFPSEDGKWWFLERNVMLCS